MFRNERVFSVGGARVVLSDGRHSRGHSSARAFSCGREACGSLVGSFGAGHSAGAGIRGRASIRAGRAFVSARPGSSRTGLLDAGEGRPRTRPCSSRPCANKAVHVRAVRERGSLRAWSAADEGDWRGSSRESLGIPRFRIAVRRECASDGGDVSTALHLANSHPTVVVSRWNNPDRNARHLTRSAACAGRSCRRIQVFGKIVPRGSKSLSRMGFRHPRSVSRYSNCGFCEMSGRVVLFREPLG